MISEVERRRKASQFYADAEDTVAMLAWRWADEKEYEDINDYQKHLQKVADRHEVHIQSMIKRPFGCKFVVIGAEGAVYKLTLNAKDIYEYQRLS